MSKYDIPPEIRRNSTFKKLTETAVASLSITDVRTAIQGVTKITPENIDYLRFLVDLMQSLLEINSSGYRQFTEQYSGDIRTYIQVSNVLQADHLIGAPLYYYQNLTVAGLCKKRKAIVTFSSNAGGSIDTDPELVPQYAAYYGVIDEIKVISGGANTPVFEIQEGSTQLGLNLSPGTLVANKPADMSFVKYNGTDATAITLDGSGCSDLGNAQSYELEITYHYET